MSIGRTLAIATNVFREAIRDRVLYLVGLYAIVYGLSLRLLPEVSGTADGKIIPDFGIAIISLVGLVVAVFVGTSLINKEIEKRTVLVLLAKPISRTEFIVGKHLGLSGVLAVLIFLMTVIYVAGLQFSQIDYSLGAIAIAEFYLFLELSLITAVALLFGGFTSSLLATLLSFAIYLVGHLSRDLVALGRLADNPEVERITQGIYLVLPDLARLDLKNQVVYGLLPDPLTLIANAGYGLLYIVLLLTLAAFVFARRQF